MLDIHKTESKFWKMVVDMELEEAKKEVLELMKEKDKIEAKLQELNVILNNVCIVTLHYNEVMIQIKHFTYIINR